MIKPVINIADVEPGPMPPQLTPSGAAAQSFGARLAPIGPRIGARQLGYNVTLVPPGKRAFPMHNHRVNEEMFFVLEGSGELRVGTAVYALRPGDVIACPAGDRSTAHQIVNTGGTELKFLAVSTRRWPEVCEYPESDKFAVLAEFESEPDAAPERFRFVGRAAQCLDYWDGE